MASFSMRWTVLTRCASGNIVLMLPFSGSKPSPSNNGTQRPKAFNAFIPLSPAVRARNVWWPMLFSPAMFWRATARFPLPEPSPPPSLITVTAGCPVTIAHNPACCSWRPKLSDAVIEVFLILPSSPMTWYFVTNLSPIPVRSMHMLLAMAPNLRVPAASVKIKSRTKPLIYTHWRHH